MIKDNIRGSFCKSGYYILHDLERTEGRNPTLNWWERYINKRLDPVDPSCLSIAHTAGGIREY